MAIDTYFKNIANAIRTKGGTVATLTPAQMPQAIADLPSGGGIPLVTPDNSDFSGDVYSGTWRGGAAYADSLSDMYSVIPGHIYLLFLGATVGNRFRSMTSEIPTYGSTSTFVGTQITNTGTNDLLGSAKKFQCTEGHYYLTITKTSQNVTGIPSYLIDLTTL